MTKTKNCVHNWDGSSKATEPDIVIEIVKEASNCGVKVKTLVGDEHSTAIAELGEKWTMKISEGQ